MRYPTQVLKQYGLAIISVVIALLLMLALDPFLHFTQASFLLFFGSVTISGLYGGRRAGIVATLLSAIFANYFFLSPLYSWALGLAETLRMALFILEGVLISVLLGSLRATQAQARQNVNQLNASEAEIKQLNQTLQRRVNELQTLFDVIPVNIAIAEDPDCQMIRVNPTFARLLQIPTTENASITPPLGQSHPTFKFYQNGQELVGETLPQQYAAKHGIALHDLEFDVVRQDGREFQLFGHAVPLFDEMGQSRGSVSVFIDISDRKQAELALRESEERLRLAMQAAHMGTWDVDLTTGKAIWSEQHFTLLGYTPATSAEASEAMWMERIHPEDRERVLHAWHQSRLDHQLYRAEYRVIRADTEQVGWLAALGSFTYDANGKAIRSLGVVQDITERKQSEDAILKLNQQLQDKVIELQTLLDLIPIGIGIAEDRECRYIRINPAFAQLLNIAPDVNASLSAPQAERPTAFKVYQNGRELQPEELPLQYAAKHGVAVHDLEVEIIRQDGTAITLLEYAVPLLDKSGQPRGSIGAFLDITNRKQVEAEREHLLQREQSVREEAERANRIKDEFLAILSHELRSPLNPILGWARLLQTKQFDETKTQQALATIERNAKLQTQLIDDLLDIARILRGKLKLHEAAVNLAAVIEAALEVVKTAAQAKSISVQCELTDIGQVWGDEGRLQQIVWNLLSNAIKFTPSGGQVKVKLERFEPSSALESEVKAESVAQALQYPSQNFQGYAQITVSDTGKGIRPDFLPHLFQSFRQEDISITRHHGGLGLGLSIVKYLVDAHGGIIAAYSPGEGQGATFTVQLPLLREGSMPSATTPYSLTDIHLDGIKVLAVDDSEDARELLQMVLTQYGAEAKIVTSGVEVLSCLEDFKPDVLICDISMPDMDGYTLLQRIRQLPNQQGSSVPALAVTAFAREEDRQRALNQGFQTHIAKPIVPEQLALAIAKLRPSPPKA